MLPTEIVFLIALAYAATLLTLALVCVWKSRQAASHSQQCYEYVQRIAELRDPTTKVAELSAEMTELADSYHALLKSHKKLRSRIGMRENRQKAGVDQDEDLSSIADKRQLRLAAKGAGLLK